MQKTVQQFDILYKECKQVFTSKLKDYGTSWRIFRLSSLTDQLFIKAKRIRTLEETNENKVGDSIASEYMGIINYCIIALIQIKQAQNPNLAISVEEATQWHEEIYIELLDLLSKKNHDYGEAWRSMRVSSFTDIILTKLYRIKQIEDNNGHTIISEGVDGNYFDCINYAMFALIHLKGEN